MGIATRAPFARRSAGDAILVLMRPFVVGILALSLSQPLVAQARRQPARKPAAKPVPLKTEPAQLECPSVLGTGLTTRRTYCDVLTGRMPAEGIVIKLPPHTGDVTLTFELHNRHTYSEELARTNRGFRQYTATIGVLTADNTLISRAVVQNEFRTEKDLVERIGGGAGPGGVKAVAPTGAEPIRMTIPGAEESVSILGEKLSVLRIDNTEYFSAPGRPIAVVSNVMLEYRPAPVRPVRRR
jgi:hypothetical protein